MAYELLWSGHLYDYSGYATANRALLFRVINTIKVQITSQGLQAEPRLVDNVTQARLDVHARVHVSARAPFLRFYVPLKEGGAGPEGMRYRICYTMMETEGGVHPEFAARINEGYDEAWVPTYWGAQQFRAGGVRVPIEVVPLGVDSRLYRPQQGQRAKAQLLTGDRAGVWEVPKGFAFITLGQPTFRKGFDFLIRAVGMAFEGCDDVALVIATTVHHAPLTDDPAVREAVQGCRAPVYHLPSLPLLDQEMARTYCGYDAYISASRGEGWNLPLCEAAACGLPVIASDVGAHRDVLPSGLIRLFPVDDYAPVPGATRVCEWYEGQRFAVLGQRSLEGLVAHLREVREKPDDGVDRTVEFIRANLSWEAPAGYIMDRVLEL